MRKDYILTPEQKQTKKKRLEENRLLRSTNLEHVKIENTIEPTIHRESVSTIEIETCEGSSLVACEYSFELLDLAQSIRLVMFNAYSKIVFLRFTIFSIGFVGRFAGISTG